MSTRGLYGFVIDGETKATYNHSDSYPSWLGKEIKEYLLIANKEKLKENVRKVRLVKENQTPTQEEIKKYKRFYNGNVNNGSLLNFYALLRESQGDLSIYEDEEFDIMIDNLNFINDSLFCEWVYLINFDTEKLEIYKGFQKDPPKNNRYSTGVIYEGYYACELLKEVEFADLVSFDMDEFEKEFYDE